MFLQLNFATAECFLIELFQIKIVSAGSCYRLTGFGTEEVTFSKVFFIVWLGTVEFC
jgi:hypothetical protein